MCVECVQLPFPHIADINGDVGCEWSGPLEMIFKIEKDGVQAKRRNVRANIGDYDEIGRILDELCCIAMVRVIVVGAMCENHVGFPTPDLPDDLPARFQPWEQLSIVVIQYLGGIDA
jgi:hypothetical protein